MQMLTSRDFNIYVQSRGLQHYNRNLNAHIRDAEVQEGMIQAAMNVDDVVSMEKMS